jgi:hypothetical protein
LKWSIKSIISNDFNSPSAKRVSLDILREIGTELPADPLYPDISIEDIVEADDNIDVLLKNVDGDDELEMIILAILEGYTKPAELSQVTEIPIDKFRNAWRRLQRRLRGH